MRVFELVMRAGVRLGVLIEGEGFLNVGGCRNQKKADFAAPKYPLRRGCRGLGVWRWEPISVGILSRALQRY
jgi:hypothetical protein